MLFNELQLNTPYNPTALLGQNNQVVMAMKYLKGKKKISPDIILNLKSINIGCIGSKSSSSCSAQTSFNFDCETKHGYVEDPDMAGEIKVLSVKKEKGCYLLRVKFKRDRDFD